MLLYDLLDAQNVWLRYWLHVGTALVMYMVIAAIGRADRYLGTESARRSFLTLLLLWFIHASGYTSAPIVNSLFSDDDEQMLLIVGVISAAWFIVLFIVGTVRRQMKSRRLA